MAHVIIEDEQYIFRRETRNKLFIVLGLGILLFVIGLLTSMSDAPHAEEEHAMVSQHEMVASAAQGHAVAQQQDEHAAAGHDAGPDYWVKRLFTTLWMNNVFFTGLGIIGLFFVAIHYAAQ